MLLIFISFWVGYARRKTVTLHIAGFRIGVKNKPRNIYKSASSLFIRYFT